VSFGGTSSPHAHDAVIVYERATGRIVHVHEVITMPGAKHPESHAMSARALEMVARRGRHAAESIATLVVPAERVKHTKHAHVDVESLTLVDGAAPSTR
jgi:hypothetical protein